MVEHPALDREGAGSIPASISMEPKDPDSPRSASSAFAHGQLWKAIETATTHRDSSVRRGAEEKALKWEAVLSGMATGALSVGSRVPVDGAPSWITLEVVKGGFATGSFSAEKPLDEAERELLRAEVGPVDAGDERRMLNIWFLSDPGLEVLGNALDTGDFRVDLPEHGAFLVAAWLLRNGNEGAALDLVAEIHPFIDRLRFTPELGPVPADSSATVHVSTAGEVATRLRSAEVPDQIRLMNQSLNVWLPLRDRLVELWLDTVDDGWPCARWPADWADRRAAWLADYDAATARLLGGDDYGRTAGNFAILRNALRRCPVDSSELTGRDVGRIRQALNATTSRWGAPGSASLRAVRAEQASSAALPLHAAIAHSVADRVAALPNDTGIADVDAAVEPVELAGYPAGVAVPKHIARKVERAAEGPIGDLLDAGIIGSSEVLAAVIPQISSHVAATSFSDHDLARLYGRIYASFRQRRSLLLLNLDHQVRITELPWVAAIEAFRTTNVAARTGAQETLRQTSWLAMSTFPQTILPNPLVSELAALAKQADLDLPFVEEIAADIFMGAFTKKFEAAARVAAQLLDETPYARYYDLPSAQHWSTGVGRRLADRVRVRWGKEVSDDFAATAALRAREAGSGDGSYVARNGAVIEQSQILTTHNLAALTATLELEERLYERGGAMASAALKWMVEQQLMNRRDWRSKLQSTKNCAYALRQALFFLSMTDPVEQRRVVDQFGASVDERGDRLVHLRPVVAGVRGVFDGRRFDERGRMSDGGRRLLGWSVGPHWLLTAGSEPQTAQR